MAKRFFPLLLVLALLLCVAVSLGEQLPSLSTERINELQELAGENGAQWSESTPPSSDMNAFQMWQWTDWFLSNRVRSLLGTIQDYEQLKPGVPLYPQAEDDQWQLRETENILSRFEAQLEEDRLAILNGISLYQSDETSATERLTVCKRILEAESEIRQIIGTICADYDTYLASVDDCFRGLQANYGGYTLDVQTSAYSSLVQAAEALEASENAAASDFSVSVISTHQFCIRVCAPDQSPIENAAVTVTSKLNGTQKQAFTDARGAAVFWVGDLGADENGELLLNLRIEAAGYRTREVQTVRLRSGETRSIDLQKDDGTPYLIMGCFNGKDILTESNSYYYSQKNTVNHTFSVKLHCDQAGELELRYTVDAKATEYKTVVKEFSAADSDNTVLEFEDQWLSKLLPGAKVSFTIKAGGEQYTTDTLLIIQKSMVEKPILSTSALFSFPGNIPFLSSLSIDIPDTLPQAVYLPSYTAMFAWGYDFKPEQANWQTRDAEDEARVIKEFEVKGKADEALAMAGAYRNINTTTQSKLPGNHEAYVTPFASLPGLYRTSDHTLELSGTAGATMAFNADITQTSQTDPAPFFAGANFNMGTGFGMDVTSTTKLDVMDGVPTVVESPEIGYKNEKAFNPVTGSENLAPLSTEELFNQLDVAADDLQFVEIGTDTYLFWIQPGTADQPARLEWKNLTDTSHYGTVSHLVGTNSNPLRSNNSYQDYAFTLEAGGDSCALTILSGKFPATTGDEPVTQSNACVATVLMKQSETRGLDMIGYQEEAVLTQSGEYPIMPEVRLLENKGEVSVLSTYATAGNPGRIDGQLYTYRPDYSDETGAKLQKAQSQTCEDVAAIVRYCIATPTASDQETSFYTLNAEGELSLLTTSSRDVLAQGEIINFRVLTSTESGNSADRLFYLEQEEGTIYCLKSVMLDPERTKTDYDIETGASLFDIVRYDGGVYLYWTECSTEEDYLVRCVRYDPGTDTAYGPFSLMQLDESPSSIKLQDSGTGFYAVDLQSASASYPCYSLSRFTFDLISSAEMTAAVLSDPCVSAGDYTELVFSVKNTGNVPLSALDVEIIDTETNKPVQTLYIDLDNPELSTNSYQSQNAVHTMTGTNALRRISSMYDPLNQEEWTITDTTAADRTVRSVRTDLLMPGDTHSYQTKIQIPADWAGGKTLVVKITDVTGESALSTADGLLLPGASQTGNTPTERLGSEATKGIDTDAHDLMLSAQLLRRSGEDYVHITIRNRSGNNNSDVTPVLTSSFRGETLFSHPFVNAMGDGFGYSMDIPLQTLTANRSLQELELYVSNADYEDFADSDNHVRLLLITQLCIVDQPVSITVTKGGEAVFSVTAAGGEKPYRCQWQCMTGADQWENIPDADQDTYRIASVQREQNGLTVRCVITDQLGNSVTSDPAELSVKLRNSVTSDPAEPSVLPQIVQLSIVDQPVNISASEGEEAMFSVTVDGGEKPYRYQWQCMTGVDQWENIPGADQDTYRIASVQPEQNGLTVRCVITDHLGNSVTSNPAALSVLPQIEQLFIVDQPVNISASEGNEAVFYVAVDGGEKPYLYQWQRMTGVDQWTDIPGADQDTYRIASVQLEQDGLTVRCVITDQSGNSVTSDSAALSVLRQPQTRSQLTLWLLLAISCVAVLAIVFYRKRSK